jgi:hypothetical protein
VTLVFAVQVTVVDVVHVVLVRHGHVSAPVTVLVRVPLVNGVAPHGTLVPVTLVFAVQVTVVDVVHVALVRHRDVPAPVTVLVRVPLVNGMLCGHLSPSKTTSGKNGNTSRTIRSAFAHQAPPGRRTENLSASHRNFASDPWRNDCAFHFHGDRGRPLPSGSDGGDR